MVAASFGGAFGQQYDEWRDEAMSKLNKRSCRPNTTVAPCPHATSIGLSSTARAMIHRSVSLNWRDCAALEGRLGFARPNPRPWVGVASRGCQNKIGKTYFELLLRAHQSRSIDMERLLAPIAWFVAVGALAGCGGDSSSSNDSPASGVGGQSGDSSTNAAGGGGAVGASGGSSNASSGCSAVGGVTVGLGGKGGASGADGTSDIVHVSSYAYANCVVEGNGSIYCWGDNGYWNMQRDGGGSYPSPVLVSLVPGSAKPIATAVGYTQMCALLADGTVQCWGNDYYAQVGTTTTLAPVPVSGIAGAVAISGGHQHTCALLTGGKVRCWGSNGYGQHGVTNVDGTVALSSAVKVMKAGRYHTVVLLSDGTIWYWGQNAFGLQGSSILAASATPLQIEGISNAIDITTEESFACALLVDGSVYCWGDNSSGVLGPSAGQSSTTPVLISQFSGAKALGSSSVAVYVLRNNGTVMTWGNNLFAVLGARDMVSESSPATIPSLQDVAFIDGGTYHACALIGGRVWCWGFPDHGQVGNGTVATTLLESVWSPYQVPVP